MGGEKEQLNLLSMYPGTYIEFSSTAEVLGAELALLLALQIDYWMVYFILQLINECAPDIYSGMSCTSLIYVEILSDILNVVYSKY